ncbi:MAG: FAD/NAD(P)-binding protein [Planctomycetes bacterium]|nr:FAD/NAD(P)-binding protein [Planctomycetota bacterium]
MISKDPVSGRELYTPRMATVKRIERLGEKEKVFEIGFDGGGALGQKPGQFVELSVFGVGEAPISISSSPSRSNGSFELAVREVGNVTAALHHMEPGAKVGIRGPFGNGFPVGDMVGQDLLFVAGGIGLFPLRSLINEVLDNRDGFGRVIILCGSKRPAERMFTAELEQWRQRDDVEFLETVDKGGESWDGNVGVITTLMPKVSIEPARTYCIVVGPPVMYKFVILEAKKKGLPNDRIVVSLERRMKCGVGKCGHCQINGVYVCQDGPVFRYSDTLHLQEAL